MVWFNWIVCTEGSAWMILMKGSIVCLLCCSCYEPVGEGSVRSCVIDACSATKCYVVSSKFFFCRSRKSVKASSMDTPTFIAIMSVSSVVKLCTNIWWEALCLNFLLGCDELPPAFLFLLPVIGSSSSTPSSSSSGRTLALVFSSSSYSAAISSLVTEAVTGGSSVYSIVASCVFFVGASSVVMRTSSSAALRAAAFSWSRLAFSAARTSATRLAYSTNEALCGGIMPHVYLSFLVFLGYTVPLPTIGGLQSTFHSEIYLLIATSSTWYGRVNHLHDRSSLAHR